MKSIVGSSLILHGPDLCLRDLDRAAERDKHQTLRLSRAHHGRAGEHYKSFKEAEGGHSRGRPLVVGSG